MITRSPNRSAIDHRNEGKLIDLGIKPSHLPLDQWVGMYALIRKAAEAISVKAVSLPRGIPSQMAS